MDENLELVIERVSRMINILEEITEIFKTQFAIKGK